MKNIVFVFLMLVTITGCKEKYNPSVHYPDTGYLVVEGFINSGQGPTQIKLSRTIALDDSMNIKSEQGAQLNVEGDDNSSYPLTEQSNGVYVNDQLVLNNAGKYRLHIRTTSGRDYFSDFASAIKTPAIDSVNWTRETTGVQIHVNTHDLENNTHYYTWNYEETWETDASYVPYVKYLYDNKGQIVGTDYINSDRSPDISGQRCWKFKNSSTILMGSSAKLAQDVIHMPLTIIENSSEKLGWLYSIRVIQHAVSARGYEFLQRLKKNTEETGSIFDAQPSELITNIHNISDSAEVVVGYIDVADMQESRIFIEHYSIPDWGYRQGCEYIVIAPRTNPDTLLAYSANYPVDYPSDIGLGVATPVCVDCRLTGGKTIKPSYWPR